MASYQSIRDPVERRTVLRTVGASMSIGPGIVLGTGNATAHLGCGTHWADGAVLDCYISGNWKYDKIYSSFKDWEHSLVYLGHDDWDGNIKIRVGYVSRTSNSSVKSTWDYYYEDGNGNSILGDDVQIMLAGTWATEDHNLWSYEHHIGRINTPRCPDRASAKKYWYHELGHGHTLSHRTDSGALMAPGDWYGLALNASETAQWRDAYDDSSCSSSSTIENFTHTDAGVTEKEAAGVPEEKIDPPTVIAKQPIPERDRPSPDDLLIDND